MTSEERIDNEYASLSELSPQAPLSVRADLM